MTKLTTLRRIAVGALAASGLGAAALAQPAAAQTASADSYPSQVVSPAPAAVEPMSPSMPIWRAQLFVRTANVPGASLDFAPTVKLNTANATLLNGIGNDFEQGAARSYDLRLDGVTTASTITDLTVTVPGGHDWCISQWSLIINGRTAASQYYGDSSCARITPASPFVVSSSALRANPSWVSYGNPDFPTGISAAALRDRIETILGHVLWGSGSGLVNGATPAVQLTKAGLGIKVNLNVSGSNVSFVINPSCDGTSAKFTTSGLSGSYAGALASAVVSQLNQAYGDLVYKNLNGSPFCPTQFGIDGPSAYVHPDGSLSFRTHS